MTKIIRAGGELRALAEPLVESFNSRMRDECLGINDVGSLRKLPRSHADRHREGLALMARPGRAQTQILRFTRPALARRWLRHRTPA